MRDDTNGIRVKEIAVTLRTHRPAGKGYVTTVDAREKMGRSGPEAFLLTGGGEGCNMALYDMSYEDLWKHCPLASLYC
jgi:hypothetical protein